MGEVIRTFRFSLWLAVLCGAGVAWASSAQVAEQDLKAAYVFNFIQFIEWPQLDQPGSEFTLCVAPFSPLKRSLMALEGKRTSDGRIVRLKLSDAENLRECRALVIDAADVARLAGPLQALAPGHGVLTIANGTPPLADAVITLAQQRGTVVFAVSPDAAARAGLTVSSRLMRLSRSVR